MQSSASAICLCVGHESTTDHALRIRKHYIYLLDALDTKYTGLIDELFSVDVRTGCDEKTAPFFTTIYTFVYCQHIFIIIFGTYTMQDICNWRMYGIDK